MGLFWFKDFELKIAQWKGHAHKVAIVFSCCTWAFSSFNYIQTSFNYTEVLKIHLFDSLSLDLSLETSQIDAWIF